MKQHTKMKADDLRLIVIQLSEGKFGRAFPCEDLDAAHGVMLDQLRTIMEYEEHDEELVRFLEAGDLENARAIAHATLDISFEIVNEPLTVFDRTAIDMMKEAIAMEMPVTKKEALQAVIKAMKHVCEHHPLANIVVVNSDLRWQFMGQDFERIVFGDEIDVSILEDMVDKLDNAGISFPYVYEG